MAGRNWRILRWLICAPYCFLRHRSDAWIMAYYPTQLPDEAIGVPARRPGGKPPRPPRVWKGVVTLVIMFLLVGAVTGIGVLEADNLHSVPLSDSAAAATVNAAGATASPAISQTPDQPGRG